MEEKKIRKELVKYGKKLVAKELVSGVGGNISIRAGKFVYLSPSGFNLEAIKSNQHVKLNLETGKIQHSALKPTCEMPMHLACYRARSNIKAVIHVHPPFAIALGCAGITLEALFPDFVVLIGNKVPLFPFFIPGSEISGQKVNEVFKNYPAVLIQNHGLVTVGENLSEAFLRAEIIEEAARIYSISYSLGKVRFLSKKEISEIEKRYKKI